MPIADTAEFLIEPRWLLPVAPGNAVLEGHAVAVGGGRILALGPAAELRQRYPTHARLVRERHALVPGLVNAHTRAVTHCCVGCRYAARGRAGSSRCSHRSSGAR